MIWKGMIITGALLLMVLVCAAVIAMVLEESDRNED